MLKFPMKGTNILVTIIVAITISWLANANQPSNPALQKSQANCTYSIEIETSCAPSAETTDHISVRFSDSLGNLIIVKHLKNPKLLYAPKEGLKKKGGAYGGFGRCAIDMFEASGACMRQSVCSLYLKRVGSDGWRPGWAKVLHQQDGEHAVQISNMFYFRTFVPDNAWYGFDYCQSRGAFKPYVASFGGED